MLDLFNNKYLQLNFMNLNLEFASCADAYQSGFTTSGVYKLSGMGYHYCAMQPMGECSGNGWTLVMKTHGTKVDIRSLSMVML